MNNHKMQGSEEFTIGVLDTGTTYTYLPNKLFNMLLVHFDWFCAQDKTHHCKGERIIYTDSSSNICFYYDENLFPEGPKAFFLSYPVLNFNVKTSTNEKASIKWYPSEYLYRE